MEQRLRDERGADLNRWLMVLARAGWGPTCPSSPTRAWLPGATCKWDPRPDSRRRALAFDYVLRNRNRQDPRDGSGTAVSLAGEGRAWRWAAAHVPPASLATFQRQASRACARILADWSAGGRTLRPRRPFLPAAARADGRMPGDEQCLAIPAKLRSHAERPAAPGPGHVALPGEHRNADLGAAQARAPQHLHDRRPPLSPGTRLVGQAYTLRTSPCGGPRRRRPRWPVDNATNPQRIAIERIGPGDVLVIDARGDVRAGTIGNILVTRMKQRGATGLVTDGAFRDATGIAAVGIPAYSPRYARGDERHPAPSGGRADTHRLRGHLGLSG